MTGNLEQLLRDALKEHSADVTVPAAGFADVKRRIHRASRSRRIALSAGAAAVAVGIVVPLAVGNAPGRSPSGSVAQPDLQEVALVTAPTTAPVPLSTLPVAATLDASVPLGLTPERTVVAGNDVWAFGRDAGNRPAVALVRVDEQKVVARHVLPHPVCSSSVSTGILVAIVTLGRDCSDTLRAVMTIDASTLVPGPILGGTDGGDVVVRDDAVYDTAGGVLERRDRATLHVNALLKLGGTPNTYINIAADPSSTHLWVTINDQGLKKTKLVEVDLDAWKVLGTRPIDANNGAIPYGAGDEVWVGGGTGSISAVRHFDTQLTPGQEAFAGGHLYAFFAWTGGRLWQVDGPAAGQTGALTCSDVDGTLLGSMPLPDTMPLGILRADKHHVFVGAAGSRSLQIYTQSDACGG